MECHNLLFELSHPERLKILSYLKVESMKLSQISKKSNISTPEMLRHIDRLNNARLVSKKADGSYVLTPFGYLVLSFIPAMNLLSKNVEYFSTHNFSPVPNELIQRIGELSNIELETGAMHVFHRVENVLSEADKYMWIMTPQILINTVPIIKERMKNEVEFRIITPKGYKPPSDFQPIKQMNVLEKTLNKVEITIIATDKYSGIAFPDLSGKMDYSIGIGGNDLKIRKWIKDLFEFYWEQAISI